MSFPLVLLHGWGLSSKVWSPLRDALSAGVPLYAPDLPGHGDAARLDCAVLEDWTDALAAHLPEKSVVCGWSLGSMLALDLAARYPSRVAKLVLIGATPRFVSGDDWPCGLAPETVDAFRSDFSSDPGDTQRRFVALQAVGDVHRRKLTGILATSLTSPMPVHQPGLAAGLQILAEADLRPRLPSIAQPVRILHGAKDALMPLKAAEWLADALPDGRLTTFLDAGHAPFITRAVDCAALIEAFMHE
ncbi:MAG: pimeloyl-ACP methyl ester esterase BioH [Zoogloea sp.]|nr:pimeloyl-ACP methyl ester esterase BioH [Zoogloea sp.]